MAIFVHHLKKVIMRLFIASFILLSTTALVTSCGEKAAETPQAFCDTVCFADSIKIEGKHKLKPYVYISGKDCKPDTITWSYEGAKSNKKYELGSMLANTNLKINKDYFRAYIRDTSLAYVMFNDCITGQNYQIRLNFAEKTSIQPSKKGINDFDPKFVVAENLFVHTDGGNLYIEDMTTGKTAMMTFGQDAGVDFNFIHDKIDSVNVTPTKAWAKIKFGKDTEWKVVEKAIELK